MVKHIPMHGRENNYIWSIIIILLLSFIKTLFLEVFFDTYTNVKCVLNLLLKYPHSTYIFIYNGFKNPTELSTLKHHYLEVSFNKR